LRPSRRFLLAAAPALALAPRVLTSRASAQGVLPPPVFTLAGNDKNNTAWFVVMRTTGK